MGRLDLRHLESFVAVAEELHFGRAAERLHVAGPWLSQVIKHVEREVGVRLLDRTTRQVALTPSGEAFLDHARRALSAVDAAQEAARRADAGAAGALAVGFSGASAHHLLPAITQRHRALHPLVSLTLVGPLFTGEQVEALLERRIDVGLGRLSEQVRSLDGVDSVVLEDDPLVALLPEGHPAAVPGAGDAGLLDPASLANEVFVTFPMARRSALEQAVRQLCQSVGFTPRVGYQVADSHVLLAMVAAGLGVTLLPQSFAGLHPVGVVVRRLTTTTNVPSGLMWLTHGSRSTVAPFVDAARHALRHGARPDADSDVLTT